jgi:hypothetical protein
MKKIKVIKAENISDYSEYKVLAEVRKPNARTSIIFVCNDPDGWSIDKLNYKIKSGEITLNEGVNAKDFPDFIQWYITLGYERIK